eukprot:scaffold131975_cov75-Phaeocystis_antarctica.AAC.2
MPVTAARRPAPAVSPVWPLSRTPSAEGSRFVLSHNFKNAPVRGVVRGHRHPTIRGRRGPC